MQQFFLGGRYPDADDVAQAYDALHQAKRSRQAGRTYAAARRTRAPRVAGNKLKVALKLLKDAGYAKQDRGLALSPASTTDIDAEVLAELADEYGRKSEADREKLERMIFYAQTAFCRWKVLLEYFEEAEDFDRCGTCDNCLDPPELRLARKTTRPRWARRMVAASAAFKTGDRVRVPRYGEGRVASERRRTGRDRFPRRTQAPVPQRLRRARLVCFNSTSHSHLAAVAA